MRLMSEFSFQVAQKAEEEPEARTIRLCKSIWGVSATQRAGNFLIKDKTFSRNVLNLKNIFRAWSQCHPFCINHEHAE